MFRSLCLFAILAVALGLLGLRYYAPAGEKNDDKKDSPQADLVGKPAPDFTTDFAINGKPGKLSDLKGKVVLVDFWAVWCPPCIASFPHLTEMNKEYKDKGLEVFGVTRYEGRFKFDKDAGKITGAKVNQEEEQTMLKDFVAHHKLEHRIATLSKDDTAKAFEAYKVEGIPTAVLIDRKGTVRMVKVGFSKENFEELEKTIKDLLKEKAEK
jgi:thiol-disulfide isomerase/thioredoxin